MKKVKKQFYISCAIMAGLSIFILYIIVLFPRFTLPDRWFISLVVLPLIFGSLALWGITKSVVDTLIYRILAILVVITAIFTTLFFMLLSQEWVSAKGFAFLDYAFGILSFGHFLLVAMIGIGLLVNRKWLPGACLLMTSSHWIMIFYGNMGLPDWLTIMLVVLAIAAWFVLVWWLKKEVETYEFSEMAEVT